MRMLRGELFLLVPEEWELMREQADETSDAAALWSSGRVKRCVLRY